MKEVSEVGTTLATKQDFAVEADLSRFSVANCNSVVRLDASDLPVLSQIDDSSGLPLLCTKVNGRNCEILLDTGSKLNLVSKDFLVNGLNISSTKLRETNVYVKGVSGNVFRAAGEIDLSFKLLGRNFTYRFVVLNGRTFPADLLLSYISIKDIICPEGAILSLVISDSSQLSNERDLVVDGSVNEVEKECMECMGCCSGCEFCSITSDRPEEKTDVCDQNVLLLQYMSGVDFHKYRLLDEEAEDSSSVLEDVRSARCESTDCCFSEVSNESRVGLVSVNEDASIFARTARDIVLAPNALTKVCLLCEEAENNEVLILNDKFVHCDVSIDNAFVKAENGNFFVYAKPNNGMTVTLSPGAKFCEIVVMKHRTVALSYEAFSSVNVGDDSERLRQELHVSDYVHTTDKLIELLCKFRSTVALAGDSLGRTNVLKHTIALQEGSTPFYVPNYRLPVGRRQVVEELITDMKKEGVVSDSKSPYNSPLLLVPKKDGSWRLVIDYRRLNSVTIPDRMPMPILSEVIANLSGASVFSSMDLLSGYWQLPLDEASKPLTAFSTHKEHLQFEVMPFGLSNAPLTFVL